MLFVAYVETHVLPDNLRVVLRINPASGVDVPDLDLGVKSPSENWCTSEPFTHAYERILGTEYDIVALITNYQTAKKSPPLRLQIIRHGYFDSHQVADRGLCQQAAILRKSIEALGEIPAQKALRFLAYANQSDWLCKHILKAWPYLESEQGLVASIKDSLATFIDAAGKAKREINPDYAERLEAVLASKPIKQAFINLADNWVIEAWRNTAQLPSHSDWERFQRSPLDGQLGVSFALQWRYNFGAFFRLPLLAP
jgi:hypothetical protein